MELKTVLFEGINKGKRLLKSRKTNTALIALLGTILMGLALGF